MTKYGFLDSLLETHLKGTILFALKLEEHGAVLLYP